MPQGHRWICAYQWAPGTDAPPGCRQGAESWQGDGKLQHIHQKCLIRQQRDFQRHAVRPLQPAAGVRGWSIQNLHRQERDRLRPLSPQTPGLKPALSGIKLPYLEIVCAGISGQGLILPAAMFQMVKPDLFVGVRLNRSGFQYGGWC